MSDADLDEIRKARLAQLQQQRSGSGSGGAPGGSSGGGQDDDRKQQEADARAHILNQILEPDAADRLGRIRLVKESRATDVENRLITLARSGQLRGKVTEAQLKELLGSLAENEQAQQEKVLISRRKGGWDDDDLDDLDGL